MNINEWHIWHTYETIHMLYRDIYRDPFESCPQMIENKVFQNKTLNKWKSGLL